MNIIYSLLLRILHSIYSLYLVVSSFRERRHWRPPQQLNSTRRRTPKHLALVLEPSLSHLKELTKAALVQSVVNAASWCREVGVQQLTVYEEHGLLNEYDQDIRFQLLKSSPNATVDSDSSESEVEYHPLTPPPSDYSDSRPISPSQTPKPVVPLIKIVLSDSNVPKERLSRKSTLKRRNRVPEQQDTEKKTLTVSLISADASKNAIAAAATSMAMEYKLQCRKSVRPRKPFRLTVDGFEALLEGEQGLSAPDFMIVHSFDIRNAQRKVPLELHNFPPWHIRLTEIHHSRLAHPPTGPLGSHFAQIPYPLDQVIFREALDKFSGAEFRLGK